MSDNNSNNGDLSEPIVENLGGIIYTPILVEKGTIINNNHIQENLVEKVYQKGQCLNLFANDEEIWSNKSSEKFHLKNSIEIKMPNNNPLKITAEDLKQIQNKECQAAGGLGQIHFLENMGFTSDSFSEDNNKKIKSLLVIKIQERDMELKSTFEDGCYSCVELFTMMSRKYESISDLYVTHFLSPSNEENSTFNLNLILLKCHKIMDQLILDVYRLKQKFPVVILKSLIGIFYRGTEGGGECHNDIKHAC